MYDIAVCDDDALDRSLLIARIEENKLCQMGVRIHEYSSGTELLSAMEKIFKAHWEKETGRLVRYYHACDFSGKCFGRYTDQFVYHSDPVFAARYGEL